MMVEKYQVYLTSALCLALFFKSRRTYLTALLNRLTQYLENKYEANVLLK